MRHSSPQTGGWYNLLAPAALGASYAMSKILTVRWLNPEKAIEMDFISLFLPGVLLGYVLRPVFQRIYWKRLMGMVAVFIMIIGLGPPGQVLEQFVWNTSFVNVEFWRGILPDLVAAGAVAGFGTILMPSPQPVIGFSEWVTRLLYFKSWSGMLRLFLGGIAYILLFISVLIAFHPELPIEQGWSRVTQFFDDSSLSPELIFFYLWLRGVLCLFVLFPVFKILRGKKIPLIMMNGSLLFVIADFIPGFTNLNDIAPYLLIEGILHRGMFDFLFSGVLISLFANHHRP